MTLIFNYGPQSGWEQGTGGTNSFLGDDGLLLRQFCLKSLQSWVGRGVGVGIQGWSHREFQRVKIKALCRPEFLAYEWGNFPHSCLRERAQSSVAGIRELLGSASWPKAVGNPPKCRRCSSGSSIWLQRAQKAKGTVAFDCDCRPNHDRVRIMASSDDPFLSEWRGSPNSLILLVYRLLDVEFFSSVNTRFGSVSSAISWRIFLHFWALMATWLSVSSWQYSILKGFTPRSSLNTWWLVDLLTPAAVAKVLQLRREFRRSFSLVFLRSWGERILRFLSRPGRSMVFPVSWNFFTIFHTVERFISSRFAISILLFSIFVKCKA